MIKTISELKSDLKEYKRQKAFYKGLIANDSFSNTSKNIFQCKIDYFKTNIKAIQSLLIREGKNQIKMDFMNYQDCEDCGDSFNIEDLKNINGKMLCEDCRDDYIPCDDCGDYLNKNDEDVYYNNSNNRICEACWNGNYVYCENCDSIIKISDSRRVDNRYLCESCFFEDYDICEDCGDYLNKNDEDVYYNNSDNRICEACWNGNYVYCENCNSIIKISDSRRVDNRYLCEDCFFEDYDICEDCGDYFHRDYMVYNENDSCYYCENCYADHENKISEFDNRQIDFNNNTFEILKYNRCFGIELEISNNEIDYYEIENNTSFGSKMDASLNYGAEFYSGILQGDKGINEIKKLCDIVKNYENDDSAGLHLHVDFRDYAKNFIAIKKVYYAYNRIEGMIFACIKPNRKYNTYCQRSQAKSEDIFNCESIEDIFKIYGQSRYFGFNLSAIYEHKTIELRYKEGNTKFEDIKNWVLLNLYIFKFALYNDIEIIKRYTENINCLDRFITFLSIISNQDYSLINYWVKQYNKYYDKSELARV